MIQIFVLLIVLIILNAIFASAEIAVISTNETKLRRMAEEGDARAGRLTRLTEQPAKFLATIQVAITMAGMLQSAVAAENFSGPLTKWLIRMGVGIPEGILKSACFFMITLLLAYFNLVFGELVPKRLAMKRSESMALGMSGLLYWVSKIFAPLVWLLTVSTDFVLRLLGVQPDQDGDVVTEEEIRMLLMEGNEKGTILPEENEIIQNVFEFDDITVEEICTHRREVIALSISDSEEKWNEIIFGSRHTYYPVCGENRDDILGVLDTKDYFRSPERSREYLMEHAVEKAYFIPETMKANVLFGQMKANQVYFSVLIDEYGVMSGIITLHDLMEALVGDLEEKEDPIRPKDMERLEEGVWRIQGRANLEDVAKEVKKTLPVDVYDTFSGYICGIVGRVPDDGEIFTCEAAGLLIDVRDVSGHIIGETIVRMQQ